MDAAVELSEVFALLESTDEISDFLQDLWTPDELERFASRWRVMRLLAQGIRPSQVHETTGVSRATIGRARRVVKYGTGIIEKLVSRSSEPC